MARPVSQGGIDYPDGGFSSGSGGFPMIGDLAEHAARTGSINAYDRRGTVIWMTDFEHGLQGPDPTGSDEECEAIISAVRSFHGGYSLKLDPSDAESSYIEWGRVIHFTPAGNTGLEVAVSTDTDPAGIRIKMLHFDGTTQQRAELHYLPSSGDWLIKTSATTWETILTGYKLQQDTVAWHPIKLVANFESGMYARAQMSREEVDISAHTLYSLPSGNLGQLAIRAMAYGAPATHAAIWIDGVIVTQNE